MVSKKGNIGLIVLTIILLIGVVSFALIRINSKNNSKNQENSNTNQAAKTGHISNDTLGISFDLPDGWSAKDESTTAETKQIAIDLFKKNEKVVTLVQYVGKGFEGCTDKQGNFINVAGDRENCAYQQTLSLEATKKGWLTKDKLVGPLNAPAATSRYSYCIYPVSEKQEVGQISDPSGFSCNSLNALHVDFNNVDTNESSDDFFNRPLSREVESILKTVSYSPVYSN